MAKASSAGVNEYFRMVATAVDKLQSRGCSQSQISYETPTGQNVNPIAPSDKSCNIFNIAGGNVPYKDYGSGYCLDGTAITSLVIGQKCDNLVYAGVSGGRRIYAASADLGIQYAWATSPFGRITGATSTSDGLSNTNTLLGPPGSTTPFPAAAACRAIGSLWYLPAINELQLLYSNRNIGAFAGTYQTGGYKMNWSSTELTNFNAQNIDIVSGATGQYIAKSEMKYVRCVRRD